MVAPGAYQNTRELSHYDSRQGSEASITIPISGSQAETQENPRDTLKIVRVTLGILLGLGACFSFPSLFMQKPLVSVTIISGLGLSSVGLLSPSGKDKTCHSIARAIIGIFLGVGSALAANLTNLSPESAAAIEFAGFLAGFIIIVSPIIARKCYCNGNR